MIGEAVGGITEPDLAAAAPDFERARAGFETLRASGSVGFADVVRDVQLRQQALGFAAQSRGRYDEIVILGIGGSALGPIAMRTALREELGAEADV